MIVCFTGHRPNKLGWYNVPNPIYEACNKALLKALEELKPSVAISGMALGVDQWAATICLELDIPFIAAIPFEGQEKAWPEHSQRIYNSLKREAAEIKYVCEPGYDSWKMQRRNEWMINKADKVIAVWDGSDGGTSNAVRYAVNEQKEVYWIKPHDNFEAVWL